MLNLDIREVTHNATAPQEWEVRKEGKVTREGLVHTREFLDHVKQMVPEDYVYLAMRTDGTPQNLVIDEKIHKGLVESFGVFSLEGELQKDCKAALFYRPINLEGGFDTQRFAFDYLGAGLLHAGLGLGDEVGEFQGHLVKALLEKSEPLDKTNCEEELGDMLWYIALACNALGTSLDAVMKKNIAKLQARFPNKFSQECANNRDLAKEREALEKT